MPPSSNRAECRGSARKKSRELRLRPHRHLIDKAPALHLTRLPAQTAPVTYSIISTPNLTEYLRERRQALPRPCSKTRRCRVRENPVACVKRGRQVEERCGKNGRRRGVHTATKFSEYSSGKKRHLGLAVLFFKWPPLIIKGLGT